ncbi:MAG: sigma 54-interacting transcriptional regulator [Deltaproteobacteria bacterium]|nr:sigma 54-interacting transcriptional regulator [Deltaproteobacteria bacterium]
MPTSREETDTMTVVRPGAPADASAFNLLVVDGPDRDATFRIDGSSPSRVLAGTSPTCSIRLSDPSVSRRHAAFDVSAGKLRLSDLGSTNGTFTGGMQIIDVLLDGGENVRLGSTTVRIERVRDSAAPPLSVRTSFGQIIGASEEMRRLYPLCEKLAESDVNVIIEGETGTGKEVLAESIHEASARASGPFVVFDCMSAPPTLLESALFGHEKGAFTGASTSRAGVFEQAHKGTLLIDEIGDLDISLQPKLLRAIQRMEVTRVGGSRPLKVDVRVMAATRRDLDKEVQGGRFRDDLFFRLNVARIELPPLRRRRGDVEILVRQFWKLLGGQTQVSPALLQAFLDYDWPGNVRELRNTVARHIALGDLARFERPSTRPPPMDGSPESGPSQDFIDQIANSSLPFPFARQQVMEEFERRYLEVALKRHGGNVTKAAAASGIARRYFHMLKARQKPDG